MGEQWLANEVGERRGEMREQGQSVDGWVGEVRWGSEDGLWTTAD